MNGGWVKVPRDRFEHPIWRGEKFCRGYAWDWLCAKAVWKDTEFNIHGRTVTLRRGQLCASTRELARAWGWSEPAVRRFLTRLKTDALIDAEADAGRTIITIGNYDTYQGQGDAADALPDAAPDARATHERRIKEEGKNIRRERREEDSALTSDVGSESATLSERGNGISHSRTRARGGVSPEEFEEWWKVYPRKVGKGQARSAYARARKIADAQTLLQAATAYAEKMRREKVEERYIKHPTTWLNGECWEDDLGQGQSRGQGQSQRQGQTPVEDPWGEGEWAATWFIVPSGLQYAPRCDTADQHLFMAEKYTKPIRAKIIRALAEGVARAVPTDDPRKVRVERVEDAAPPPEQGREGSAAAQGVGDAEDQKGHEHGAQGGGGGAPRVAMAEG